MKNKHCPPYFWYVLKFISNNLSINVFNLINIIWLTNKLNGRQRKCSFLFVLRTICSHRNQFIAHPPPYLCENIEKVGDFDGLKAASNTKYIFVYVCVFVCLYVSTTNIKRKPTKWQQKVNIELLTVILHKAWLTVIRAFWRILSLANWFFFVYLSFLSIEKCWVHFCYTHHPNILRENLIEFWLISIRF